MARQDFIQSLEEHATRIFRNYKILPSLTIAQASLESNFGESGLSQKANNLFGIKGTYNDQYIVMQTAEYRDGERVTVDARFRKYPSYYESLEDYAKLIQNGVSWNRELYHGVIGVTDWRKATEEIGNTPYATDPNYTDKLNNIIEQYRLFEIDERALNNNESDGSETTNQTEPYPNHAHRFGDRGDHVKLIQEKLGIETDGSFGMITQAYVIVYQHKNKLKIDGIVGPETWGHMFK